MGKRLPVRLVLVERLLAIEESRLLLKLQASRNEQEQAAKRAEEMKKQELELRMQGDHGQRRILSSMSSALSRDICRSVVFSAACDTIAERNRRLAGLFLEEVHELAILCSRLGGEYSAVSRRRGHLGDRIRELDRRQRLQFEALADDELDRLSALRCALSRR